MTGMADAPNPPRGRLTETSREPGTKPAAWWDYEATEKERKKHDAELAASAEQEARTLGIANR